MIIQFVEKIGVIPSLVLIIALIAILIPLLYLAVLIEGGLFDKNVPSNKVLKKAFKEVGYNQPFTVDQNGKVIPVTEKIQ